MTRRASFSRAIFRVMHTSTWQGGRAILACLLLGMACVPATRAQTPGTTTPVSTPTITATRSPSLTPTVCVCIGNCVSVASREVTAEEIFWGTQLAVGREPQARCAGLVFAFDANHDGGVTIDELVKAVRNANYGCCVNPATRTPTASPTPSQSRAPTRTNLPSWTPSPSATFTPTSTPTPTSTATRTPTVTPTRTATLTPTQMPTQTPTLSGMPSVCGGFVGTSPVVCGLSVIPNPVPLLPMPSYFRAHYCLADLEGDVNRLCIAIRTSPLLDPIFNCQSQTPASGAINACGESGQILSTNPVGSYSLLLYVEDRQGHRSLVVETPFTIR